MKIYIRDIRQDGLDVQGQVAPGVVGLTKDDDLRFIEPLQVKGRVYKMEDIVAVNLTAQGKYSSFCWRCLDPIEKEWTASLSMDCPIHKNLEYIDLDEDIRQEVFLNLPSRMICREDCKGLCPQCGVNLNQEECKCTNKTQKDAKIHVKHAK